MVSANREMVVYCFDTLVAHYNKEPPPPPDFEEGHHPLFVTWKKAHNGSEPRLRGCIGSLEARDLINGFKDYALASLKFYGKAGGSQLCSKPEKALNREFACVSGPSDF